MSSPLAIAAVTATLKDLLNDGLLNHDLSAVGSFSVTALPPDRVVTGTNEPNQLNLFLYQVTPNLGWRNAGQPSRDATGARLTNAPLALDLHYLLTAYGAQDFNAEILLGYAMQLIHENPVLTRAQLRTSLATTSPVDGSVLPGPFSGLSAIDLADQIELVKLTPVFLNAEELSKLWTAMQARYRPTMAYMASVVLIERSGGERVAPPVLQRGPDDRGATAAASPPPNLARARPAASDLLPAMRLGDDVLAIGNQFPDRDTITALFDHPRLDAPIEVVPVPGFTATQMTVHIPTVAEDATAMSRWAIGAYTLSLRVARSGQPDWTTNGVPIALAPRITVSPLTAAPGTVALTLTCSPRLLPAQELRTFLIFGSRQIAPATIVSPADPTQPTTLTFSVPGVVAGRYVVRLRVEGIDSLAIVWTGSPPRLEFDPLQTVVAA